MSLSRLRSVLLSRQFILYTIIGFSGVILDILVFLLLTNVLHINVFIANAVSISAGIFNNFYLNYKFNFKKKDQVFKRFVLFYAVGLLGILLSQVLLYLFYEMIGINSSVAKVLTLPFILVFQYLLNRRFSFGELSSKQTSSYLRKLVFHWPAILIILFYSYLSITMISSIPSDHFSQRKSAARVSLQERGGPDEVTHYRFNVDFILQNRRLPVSGVDDVSAYQSCRDNPIGKVPCVYSYVTYPGPNYVASAVFAKVFSDTGRLTPMVAARVTSLFSGIIFVAFAYGSAYLITRRRLYSTILTTVVSFIPQLIFVNSYVNMDAHSLAISSLLGFALVGFMQNPRSKKWQIFLSFTLFGLLPLAKYNFFILGLMSTLLVVRTFKSNRFKIREILNFLFHGLTSFILFSSFWYIRNLVLYRDIFGQNFVLQKMSEFHPLGISHGLTMDSFILLVKHDYFNTLYRSFFVAYGQMTYFLQDYMYIAVQLALLICLSLTMYFLFEPAKELLTRKLERLNLIRAFALYFLTFLLIIATVVYNSLQYDFQPQGRYLYPILIPTVLIFAYAIKHDPRFKIITYIFLAVTTFIFIQGVDLYVRAYLVVR